MSTCAPYTVGALTQAWRDALECRDPKPLDPEDVAAVCTRLVGLSDKVRFSSSSEDGGSFGSATKSDAARRCKLASG